MDTRLIKRLVEIVEASDIAELEVKEGESMIRISRASSLQMQQPVMVHSQYAPAPAAVAAAPAPVVAQAEAAASATAAPVAKGVVMESPMVGTFYASSTPGGKPFASVGQKVNVGDTLCIVEAMKIMNQIEAEVAGTILDVLVKNGDPVEFGQPLFVIG